MGGAASPIPISNQPETTRQDPPDCVLDAAELALLERLRAGDEAAFAILVREHGARLLGVAKRIVQNDDDAIDALQDAFISAYRALETFSGASKLSTWLHRIVVNASLMKLRSRKRRREVAIADLLPRFLPDGHQTEEAAEWHPPEVCDAERAETRDFVRRMIDRLSDDYRTVLLLRDIEELDTRQVAELLDLNENTVKVRLHRARQALRKLLDPHYRDNGE